MRTVPSCERVVAPRGDGPAAAQRVLTARSKQIEFAGGPLLPHAGCGLGSGGEAALRRRGHAANLDKLRTEQRMGVSYRTDGLLDA